jgi:hypothetical protein
VQEIFKIVIMSSTKPKKRRKGHPNAGHPKRRRSGHGFSGTPAKAGKKNSVTETLIETGKYLAFVAGGGVLGAAIGKPSLYLGLPVALYAFYKKMPLLGAAAVSAMFTPVIVPTTATSGYEDMEGIDIKQLETDAKARLEAYFKGISDKLYLPKSTANKTLQPVTGLNGNEDAMYFINPNSMGEAPDLSRLDKIQEQIAQLSAGNGTAITGYGEDDLNNI